MNNIFRSGKFLLAVVTVIAFNNMVTLSAKEKAPKAKKYKIGELLEVINKGGTGVGTFVLLTDASGKPLTDKELETSAGWKRCAGSKSVDSAFGAGYTNKLSKGETVKLEKDKELISKLQEENRLPSGSHDLVKHVQDRLLLYFVYKKGSEKYRFYINDPFPGKGITTRGNVHYPMQEIADKFDLSN